MGGREREGFETGVGTGRETGLGLGVVGNTLMSVGLLLLTMLLTVDIFSLVTFLQKKRKKFICKINTSCVNILVVHVKLHGRRTTILGFDRGMLP